MGTKLSDVPPETLFVEYLGYLYPGSDVRVTFRTTENRQFKGYWKWNLMDMRHEQTTLQQIRTLMGGSTRGFSCPVLTIRWKNVIRFMAKKTGLQGV